MAEKKWWDHNKLVSIFSIAGVGVSLGVVAYLVTLRNREQQQQLERRQCLKWIRRHFDTKKTEILQYIGNQTWNEFDAETLKKIFTCFLNYSTSHKHGEISRENFFSICNELGMHDPQVKESLFNSLDHDHSLSIDFLEFLEAMNLLCFGSARARLTRLFIVADLNHDHKISVKEMTRMYRALFAGYSTDVVDRNVELLFRACDSNHDKSLTLEEFVRLASLPGLKLNSVDSFNYKFLQLFGVDTSQICERAF